MKKNTVLSCLALLPLLPLFALAPRADGALTCTFVSVSGVNFGSYDVFNAIPTKATGSITYQCKKAGGPQLMMMDLSRGAGTFTNRTLLSGGNILNYNLYPDAANSQAWGDGNGTYHYVIDPTDAAVVTLTVYGTIPAGQDVGVGGYSDTITVTMNF
jgi:spore coat protein U-like protein